MSQHADPAPAPTRSPVGRPVSVAVLHDSPVVVEGLIDMLEPHADRVTLTRSTGDLPNVDPSTVDVALVELSQDLDDVAAHLGELKDASGADRVVVFGHQFTHGLLRAAVDGGASGYLSMTLDAAGIADALVAVRDGDAFVACHGEDRASTPFLDGTWFGKAQGLTRRESEVVVYIALGLSNRQVAERARLAMNTVKTYIRSAYQKMGVTSRAGAVLWAVDQGFTAQDW